MSTRQDDRDPERRRFALLLIMAIVLAAIVGTCTGCAGINFRHLAVRVDGERVVIPDAIAKQYFRLRIPRQEFTTGNWSYAEFPTPMLSHPHVPDHACARLSGRLVRWCWANGYPDAAVAIFRRSGYPDHAQVVIEIEGQPLYFDLTIGSIEPHGPKHWTHWRDAFKHEVLNVKEWQ